jgi:hypothetical protein
MIRFLPVSPVKASSGRSSARPKPTSTTVLQWRWLWLELGFLLLFGLALSYIFTSVVPPNMDEHLAHHVLACYLYPHNFLNTFRESCTGYDLTLLQTLVLPLRANAYVGNVHALLYWPLLWLWPNPISLRFFGFLFLLVQGIFVARILRVRPSVGVLLLLLCFPYAVMHLADVGPVGYQTTSVFVALWLWQYWGKKLKAWPMVLSAVVLAAGVWSKLTYFWMMPGILLLFCHELYVHRAVLWAPARQTRTLMHILVALGVFTLLVSLFMFGTSPGSTNDFVMLRQMWDSPKYGLEDWLNGSWFNSSIVANLLNPLAAAQRQFAVPAADTLLKSFSLLAYLSVPLCLFLLRHIKPKNEMQARAATSYVAFLFTLVAIVTTKNASFMHHTVLAFPFLVLAGVYTLAALQPKWKPNSWRTVLRLITAASLAIFVVANVGLYVVMSRLPLRPTDDPGRAAINRFLHDPYLASNYLYVVTDWGMYYTQALYGDRNQAVVYVEPFFPAAAATVRNLAWANNRKLLFIYQLRSDSAVHIRDSFEVMPCQRGAMAQHWNIVLEPDTDMRNPCRVFPRAK